MGRKFEHTARATQPTQIKFGRTVAFAERTTEVPDLCQLATGQGVPKTGPKSFFDEILRYMDSDILGRGVLITHIQLLHQCRLLISEQLVNPLLN